MARTRGNDHLETPCRHKSKKNAQYTKASPSKKTRLRQRRKEADEAGEIMVIKELGASKLQRGDCGKVSNTVVKRGMLPSESALQSPPTQIVKTVQASTPKIPSAAKTLDLCSPQPTTSTIHTSTPTGVHSAARLKTPFKDDMFLSQDSQTEVKWDCNSPDTLRQLQLLQQRASQITKDSENINDIVKKLVDEASDLPSCTPPLLSLWMENKKEKESAKQNLRPIRKKSRSRPAGIKSSLISQDLISKLTDAIQQQDENNSPNTKNGFHRFSTLFMSSNAEDDKESPDKPDQNNSLELFDNSGDTETMSYVFNKESVIITSTQNTSKPYSQILSQFCTQDTTVTQQADNGPKGTGIQSCGFNQNRNTDQSHDELQNRKQRQGNSLANDDEWDDEDLFDSDSFMIKATQFAQDLFDPQTQLFKTPHRAKRKSDEGLDHGPCKKSGRYTFSLDSTPDKSEAMSRRSSDEEKDNSYHTNKNTNQIQTSTSHQNDKATSVHVSHPGQVDNANASNIAKMKYSVNSNHAINTKTIICSTSSNAKPKEPEEKYINSIKPSNIKTAGMTHKHCDSKNGIIPSASGHSNNMGGAIGRDNCVSRTVPASSTAARASKDVRSMSTRGSENSNQGKAGKSVCSAVGTAVRSSVNVSSTITASKTISSTGTASKTVSSSAGTRSKPVGSTRISSKTESSSARTNSKTDSSTGAASKAVKSSAGTTSKNGTAGKTLCSSADDNVGVSKSNAKTPGSEWTDMSLTDDLLCQLAEPDDILDSQPIQLSGNSEGSSVSSGNEYIGETGYFIEIQDNRQLQGESNGNGQNSKALDNVTAESFLSDDDGLGEPQVLAMLDEIEIQATQSTSQKYSPQQPVAQSTSQKYSPQQSVAQSASQKYSPHQPVTQSASQKYSAQEIERKKQEALKRRQNKLKSSQSQNSSERKNQLRSKRK